MSKRHAVTRSLSMAVVAATLAAGAITTAPSASAATPPDEYIAILPTNEFNQKIDLSHGGFNKPVGARDSSALSLAEQWELIASSTYPGTYYLNNRYTAEGIVWLKGGGSVGSAATSSAFNSSDTAAYRWKIVGDRFSAKLVNVKTGLNLTYHKAGTGYDDKRFTMDTANKGAQNFNVKHLSFP